MSRLALILLSLLVVGLALSGCGPDKPPPRNVPKVEKPTTLTRTQRGDIMVGMNDWKKQLNAMPARFADCPSGRARCYAGVMDPLAASLERLSQYFQQAADGVQGRCRSSLLRMSIRTEREAELFRQISDSFIRKDEDRGRVLVSKITSTDKKTSRTYRKMLRQCL